MPKNAKTKNKPKARSKKSDGNSPLVIFLSHKLGHSKSKAIGVARELSLLANDRMKVIYSAAFPRGNNWENDVRQGLHSAHWFILLYDGPDTNHDWCLWEAGYFRAQIAADPRKKMFCLHDPRHSLPGPLKMYTSVPARQDEVFDLFKQIYLEAPWKINPALFADQKHTAVQDRVRQLIKEVSEENEILAQFTLSPTFTFHVSKDALQKLVAGEIPPDTQVSGEGPWETIFGRPDATISWSWGELTSGLEDWEPWAHQLAGMMSDAYKYLSVSQPSIALRIKLRKDESEHIYRVILRRLEKTAEESRFTFAAANIITPFLPNNHLNETRIFHLYNMAWFFRRQFLEKHLSTLRHLVVLRNPPKTRIEEEVRSISDDMTALLTDAQVRGVEDPATLIFAFEEPIQSRVSTALLDEWPRLYSALQTACAKSPIEINAIIQAIRAMDEINKYFLETCLQELLRRGPSGL